MIKICKSKTAFKDFFFIFRNQQFFLNVKENFKVVFFSIYFKLINIFVIHIPNVTGENTRMNILKKIIFYCRTYLKETKEIIDHRIKI